MARRFGRNRRRELSAVKAKIADLERWIGQKDRQLMRAAEIMDTIRRRLGEMTAALPPQTREMIQPEIREMMIQKRTTQMMNPAAPGEAVIVCFDHLIAATDYYDNELRVQMLYDAYDGDRDRYLFAISQQALEYGDEALVEMTSKRVAEVVARLMRKKIDDRRKKSTKGIIWKDQTHNGRPRNSNSMA